MGGEKAAQRMKTRRKVRPAKIYIYIYLSVYVRFCPSLNSKALNFQVKLTFIKYWFSDELGKFLFWFKSIASLRRYESSKFENFDPRKRYEFPTSAPWEILRMLTGLKILIQDAWDRKTWRVTLKNVTRDFEKRDAWLWKTWRVTLSRRVRLKNVTCDFEKTWRVPLKSVTHDFKNPEFYFKMLYMMIMWHGGYWKAWPVTSLHVTSKTPNF